MIDAGRQSKIVFSRNLPREPVFIHEDTDGMEPNHVFDVARRVDSVVQEVHSYGNNSSDCQRDIRMASAYIGSLLLSGLPGICALVET